MQSSSGQGRTTVVIKQTAQTALLQWETFNVGKHTTLNFDQTSGGKDASKWIAFNQVNDPSGSPSQILGSINGVGQVYVLNRNGILFGGTSQINLHGLVASSLPIDTNLQTLGLLNYPGQQFLFSALPQGSGVNVPAFTPPLPLDASHPLGDVVVQEGATISAPSSNAHVGGRVILIGPNVSNAGSISTPDGQTILAAGLQVGLASHASNDPQLRGLDVFVGAVAAPAASNAQLTYSRASGTTANSGWIDAPRADVTLAGSTVNQLGAVTSTTSVSENGRVDLLANFGAVPNTNTAGGNQAPFFFKKSGNITLGQGSVTQILPQLSDPSTVVGSVLALVSQVQMQGKTVHLQPGSSVFAPDGAVNIMAGAWAYTGSGSNASSPFVYTSGQVYIDSGAWINAAGSSDVKALMSENILQAQLLGPELAGSPLQRNGPFRGSTIRIDLRERMSIPIADITGYIGAIQRNVGELTVGGGSVSLNAGSSVVMQPGSSVNVSGGWLDYQSGMIETTRVAYGGQILDIGKAPAGLVYQGIYTGKFTVFVPKWGVTDTFQNALAPTGSRYEPGYVQGANGGSMTIHAPQMALDGDLVGATISGPRQRSAVDASSGPTSANSMPSPGALELAFQSQDTTQAHLYRAPAISPEVLFGTAGSQAPAASFSLSNAGDTGSLVLSRQKEVVLSQSLLTKDGFGSLTVYNPDGTVFVPAHTRLTTSAGGSVNFTAANITIAGDVRSPGGTIRMTADNISPTVYLANQNLSNATTPRANSGRGAFTLLAGGTLSAAGVVADDRLRGQSPGAMPLVVDGGTVTVSGFSANFAPGSSIDVSAGLDIGPTGTRTYGAGGSIGISAGQDPELTSVLGGKLALGAQLSGYARSQGGKLSILAPAIQVGGPFASSGVLHLAPSFFDAGGFESYSLTGLGIGIGTRKYLPGVVIAPGTVIAPKEQSVIPITTSDGFALAHRSIPSAYRSPVSIAFDALGVLDPYRPVGQNLIVRGDLVMGEGVSIAADPSASISFKGDTVAILGSVAAPGGVIAVIGGNDSTSLFQNGGAPLPTVDIGPRSSLSVAGVNVPILDMRGNRNGMVLDGGSISVKGNIIAEKGSRLNVAGASAVLDLPRTMLDSSASPEGSFLGFAVRPARVDSNGGQIAFTGGQMLYTDASLKGGAGGPASSGGSLSVNSGRFYGGGQTPNAPLDPTLVVTQKSTLPGSYNASGLAVIGNNPLLGQGGNALRGVGHFAANAFNYSGLDSINLGGTVVVTGDVSLAASQSLSAATAGVLYADGNVHLSAPDVSLGTPLHSPFAPSDPLSRSSFFTISGTPEYFSPTFGKGRLTVTARLIDIGNLSLQGIGNANLIADSGVIRGDGTLDVAGSLYLRAASIYPPSETKFTISASDYKIGAQSHAGSVTIARSGDAPLPLSAGGQLNVYGSVIRQGGVLEAPIGTINLGWNSLGAVPVDAITGKGIAPALQVTLSRGSETSVSGVDPFTGKGLLIPYGANPTGVAWFDPAGIDITASGAPTKSINISAASLVDQSGSSISIKGGGDIFSYRFVPGTTGQNDILAPSTASFAVLPGFSSEFAPFAPFNSTSQAVAIGGDPGYTSNLKPGDRIYLGKSSLLAAGAYTLLPARYALLPGAYLITPKSGAPVGSITTADGSSLVSGHRLNAFDTTLSAPPLNQRFEVDPPAVIAARAKYDTFTATGFLAANAAAGGKPVPLPADGGHLILSATRVLTLYGQVAAEAGTRGLGGLVDISSPNNIFVSNGIDKPGAALGGNVVQLSASELSSFGAGSILVGGYRFNTNGSPVSPSSVTAQVFVATPNIEVGNAGTPLTGQDVILAAMEKVALDSGASVRGAGVGGTAQTLAIGTAGVSGSGNGALLRVSSAATAAIVREAVDAGVSGPNLFVAAGASISGASATLDSTHASSIDSTAKFSVGNLALDSGQISLELQNPGALQSGVGLMLSSTQLKALQSSHALSLLSYSTIDTYGAGSFGGAGLQTLAFHGNDIRGFNTAGGLVTFTAGTISLDNTSGGIFNSPIIPATGSIAFNAGTIRLGMNTIGVDQYQSAALNAAKEVLLTGSGGLRVGNALKISTPLITAAGGARQSISAEGALDVEPSVKTGISTAGAGLGAHLKLIGSSVTENSSVVLHSGSVSVEATGTDNAADRDLTIGGRIDVSGAAQHFYDLTRYTDGGNVTLSSDLGKITLGSTSRVSVAASNANPGQISIAAPNGSLAIASGAGVSGSGLGGGSFSLDSAGLSGGSFASLAAVLKVGGFNGSIAIRDRSDANVLIDSNVAAHTFSVSADRGSIEIAQNVTVDASGITGGSIGLFAAGSVTLDAGSVLTVAARTFDSAGKGGAVSLEAGSVTSASFDPAGAYTPAANGWIDLQTGSSILLGVSQAPVFGEASGTLHLRAPQIANNAGDPTGVQIHALNGTISGGSSIVVEGFQVFRPADGQTIDLVENAVKDGGARFAGGLDSTGAQHAGIAASVMASLVSGTPNAGLASIVHVQPGAEVDNPKGALLLNADWDLSNYRFGAFKPVVDSTGAPVFDNNGLQIFSGAEPGILTVRAAGSITLNGSLSDGFGDGAGALDYPFDDQGAPELSRTTLLPVFQDGTSQRSWSYRITAGADFGASDFHRVAPFVQGAGLGQTAGSLELGIYNLSNIATNVSAGSPVVTSSILETHYQVIRTGAGEIDISAQGDVNMLNQFATIYTAGSQVADPSMKGTFDIPILAPDTGIPYAPQYSFGGGNVFVAAQGNIAHLTNSLDGSIVPDSGRQLPIDWLYRRGYVSGAGTFGKTVQGDVASTTWWTDFSNFFQGVGALGGGNVTLRAGMNVSDIDGVIPTNARVAARDAQGRLTSAIGGALVELGGGDLTVRAGQDVIGGVYYVERGFGSIAAGRDVTTDFTRSPSLGSLASGAPVIDSPLTWLPTTLFAGKASFSVSAGSGVLLGPVSNPFLLPQGLGNTTSDRTYFSTFSPSDAVNVMSLAGDVTFRDSATLPTGQTAPILQVWANNVLSNRTADNPGSFQPWLQIDPLVITSVTGSILAPARLSATAFSGSVNLIGAIDLSPSATGNVEILASGAINGLQPDGFITVTKVASWLAGTLNLSDADPSAIPGVDSPIGFQSVPQGAFLQPLDQLFAETGSYSGSAAVLQAKQALHTPGLLHHNDGPAHLYAGSGDISGLTLFSSKATRAIAGGSITDVSLYIQNDQASDITVVSAARDIVPHDPNSPLRNSSNAAGNALIPLAGDLQISGPGTVEVLAGRNLTLGQGAQNSDGTGAGISTIGNARNPYLGFAGADVIAGAGIGGSQGLDQSKIGFAAFIRKYLDPSTSDGRRYLSEVGPLLSQTSLAGALGPIDLKDPSAISTALNKVAAADRDALALQAFYIVLRDAGRDHTLPGSAGFNNYNAGFAAITTLFPGSAWRGDIDLSARSIATNNGGDISIFAPGGQLTLGAIAETPPPGIVTQSGGNISIYTNGNVDIGVERIFTLRGGNEIIWSTHGNIAAGSSSKTVQSAPPTRVLIDPQSADVQTDLSGLATGGGIGVLATVVGVPPGDVDLIAPTGTVDAGDAGIRVTGNLNISAVQVLNASNIQVGGSSSGVPTVSAPSVSIPSIGAASTQAAGNDSAKEALKKAQQAPPPEDPDSVILVEVIGYGGGDGTGDSSPAPSDALPAQ